MKAAEFFSNIGQYFILCVLGGIVIYALVEIFL